MDNLFFIENNMLYLNQTLRTHMKKNILDIHPQFITDAEGKKTGVIMNIETFLELIEKIEDLYFGAQAHATLQDKEKFNDFENFKKDLLK